MSKKSPHENEENDGQKKPSRVQTSVSSRTCGEEAERCRMDFQEELFLPAADGKKRKPRTERLGLRNERHDRYFEAAATNRPTYLDEELYGGNERFLNKLNYIRERLNMTSVSVGRNKSPDSANESAYPRSTTSPSCERTAEETTATSTTTTTRRSCTSADFKLNLSSWNNSNVDDGSGGMFKVLESPSCWSASFRSSVDLDGWVRTPDSFTPPHKRICVRSEPSMGDNPSPTTIRTKHPKDDDITTDSLLSRPHSLIQLHAYRPLLQATGDVFSDDLTINLPSSIYEESSSSVKTVNTHVTTISNNSESTQPSRGPFPRKVKRLFGTKSSRSSEFSLEKEMSDLRIEGSSPRLKSSGDSLESGVSGKRRTMDLVEEIREEDEEISGDPSRDSLDERSRRDVLSDIVEESVAGNKSVAAYQASLEDLDERSNRDQEPTPAPSLTIPKIFSSANTPSFPAITRITSIQDCKPDLMIARELDGSDLEDFRPRPERMPKTMNRVFAVVSNDFVTYKQAASQLAMDFTGVACNPRASPTIMGGEPLLPSTAKPLTFTPANAIAASRKNQSTEMSFYYFAATDRSDKGGAANLEAIRISPEDGDGDDDDDEDEPPRPPLRIINRRTRNRGGGADVEDDEDGDAFLGCSGCLCLRFLFSSRRKAGNFFS